MKGIPVLENDNLEMFDLMSEEETAFLIDVAALLHERDQDASKGKLDLDLFNVEEIEKLRRAANIMTTSARSSKSGMSAAGGRSSGGPLTRIFIP